VKKMMVKRYPKLSVAIPASFVSDVPHLREKTSKIGMLGRALAVFRVEEVIVFPDQLRVDQKRDINLIFKILTYIETPQYLRKKLFRISSELRFVGILPPLRTPHHPLKKHKKDLRIGDFREGVVVAVNSRETLVDIGIERPASIFNIQIPLNSRITVKVIEIEKNLKITIVDSGDLKSYWGFKVIKSKFPFGQMVEDKNFDLVVATSRRGIPVMKVVEPLSKALMNSKGFLVAFGSPTQGLHEILKQEKRKLNEVANFIVNTIPHQATKTIRTEEAVYATLAVLNLLN
jgi:predicted SPOUT superfamily RNA methylase MTH1